MVVLTKAAIYCRVSTKEQKESGTSLDSQESRAREYADHKNRNYRVLDHLVVKEDWTGTDLDRPWLKKLLVEAERGSFDVLIIYTLDRLYRPKNEGEEWRVFELLGRFNELGVRVEFVDPTANMNQSLGPVVGFMKIWLAGQERRDLLERMGRGRESRIAEGKWVQGSTPYGYRRGQDGYLVKDTAEATIVSSIFTDYVERRQGVRLLQERLNRTVLTRKGRSVWSQSVIHRMLRNPIYIGRHASGIKAPPIISEELFDRAIARLIRNRRLHRHAEKITPLQGLVDCHCGATWRIERAKPARKSPAYMYCFHRRRQSNWVTGGNPRCTVPPIRLDRFERLIHSAFKETFSDPVRFKLMVENTIRDLKRDLIEKQADIQPLRDELAKVSDRIRRISHEYLEGEIDEEELDRMRERARHRRTVLEDRLATYSPTRIDELEDLERLIRGAEDHIRLAETREQLGMPMGEFSWNPELAISEAAQEYTDSGVWPRKGDVNHREIAEDLERWLSYLDARIVVEEGTARVSGTIPQEVALDNDTLHASRNARGLGCG